MIEADFFNLFLLPIGFGLFGFVEPCSIGSTLLFIKYIEGKSAAFKLSQTLVFMISRAVFIGLLGASAALLGGLFLQMQRGGWLLLGAIYLGLGAIYLIGKGDVLSRTIGLRLERVSGVPASVGLGIFFGLNIPACAAPLIFALLGNTALSAGANMLTGFISLALFGMALSLPLAVAVLFPSARALLDRFAALSKRLPFWTGVLFVALGLWSIYFALFVNLEA